MKSRSTFREKAGEVCWQKQLRDRYLAEGTPPVPHLDVKRAIVRPVSRRFAEQIILKYEWLGTMSPTTWHYGIFFGDCCAGVCCIGHSAGTGAPTMHRKYGIEKEELAILARGACVHWAPNGTNSRLTALACRYMQRTGKKLMVAFSDEDAGEIGTIYQSCNWLYVGKGVSSTEWISPMNRVYSSRLTYNMCKVPLLGFRPQAKAARVLLANGWKKQKSNSKHIYCYILDKRDKALMRRIEGMSLPYPKRSPKQTEADDQLAQAGQNRPGRSNNIEVVAND